MRSGISPAGPGIVRFTTRATGAPGGSGRAAAAARDSTAVTVPIGGVPRLSSMSRTARACGSRGIAPRVSAQARLSLGGFVSAMVAADGQLTVGDGDGGHPQLGSVDRLV